MMHNQPNSPKASMNRNLSTPIDILLPKPPPDTQTPPPKNRAARAKAHSRGPRSRPALRETFLDYPPRSDNARGKANAHARPRDSHDLSLSPRHVTRDSIVDNMLLSLNGGSSPDHSSVFSALEDDPRLKSPRASRHRGHAQSSSYSPEIASNLDDPSSRYSKRLSRSRRSNSSSNFHSGLRRIKSIRPEDRNSEDALGELYDGSKPTSSAGTVSPITSRGGRLGSKSSKSSGLNSESWSAGSRWPHSIGRRSSSFDQSQSNQPSYSSSLISATHSPITNSRFQPLRFDATEAAPTPTVPAGPRRDNSPLTTFKFPPQAIHAPSQDPAYLQKNSDPSHRIHYTWKGKVDTPKDAEEIGEALNGMEARSITPELPPPPAFVGPRAPSPVVSYRKPSRSVQGGASQDRPGFFRRMFGSSRNSSPLPQDLRPPQLMPHDRSTSRSSARTDSRLGSHFLPPSRLSKPSVVETTDPMKQSTPAPLSKKTSSFFRRRKQSISENRPPPTMLPSHLRPTTRDGTSEAIPEPSPVSSLRQVMNPYLNSPVPSQHHPSTIGLDSEISDYDAAFLAGYLARNESTMDPTVSPKKSKKSISIASLRARSDMTSRADSILSNESTAPTTLSRKGHRDDGNSLPSLQAESEDAFIAGYLARNESTVKHPVSPRNARMSSLGSKPPREDPAEAAFLAACYFARNDSMTRDPFTPVEPADNDVSSPSPRGRGDLNSTSQEIPKSGDDILSERENDSFLHERNDDSGDETKTGDRTTNEVFKSSGQFDTNQPTPRFSSDSLRRHENDGMSVCAVDTVRQAGHRTKDSTGTLRPLSRRCSNIPTSTRVSSITPKSLDSNDWNPPLRITPSKGMGSPGISSSKPSRVYLKPTASEEELGIDSKKFSLPLEGTLSSTQASMSNVSYYSTSSQLPEVQVDDHSNDVQPSIDMLPSDEAPSDVAPSDVTPENDEIGLIENGLDGSVDVDSTEPTEEDRTKAREIYCGDESIVSKAKAAAWLGDSGLDRARVRRAYMELFGWKHLNILAALRMFCSRILLKGETQQVDRVLDAFSSRWCACNPDHGFKATDVVHTISYSILLLNTDLHMAEIEQKMTRSQFIKNTIPSIRRVAADAAPDGFEIVRVSTLSPARSPIAWVEGPSGGGRSPTFPFDTQQRRISNDGRRPNYRLSTRPSDQSGQELLSSHTATPLDYDAPIDDCGPLVKAPFHGKLSTWEVQVEIVLKDFYNSISKQRLPLHRHETTELLTEAKPSTSSLSVFSGNLLRRTPSTLSKAGSENYDPRGRPLEHRFGTGRWTSKTRSRPRLYPASTVTSSRTSLDDQSSGWSPSVSSTWSRYSFGRTQTSMSVDSFTSSFPQADYQQSIGFANALSQAIIREEAAITDPIEENLRVASLLEDESLELAGAPWAKEGILKHKHHLESVDKKAKDRNWTECFAVVEKGYLSLFSFSMNAKSMRQKAKNQKAPGNVVGGGNWTENAEALGKFMLRHTIASALPPPGYSRARPNVWALSLPTGAVHLFSVGTPEIVKEFVSTANYWSARLSKEPLVGGVSNVEYGWGEGVINTALISNEARPPSAANAVSRPSLQSSIRSSLDQGSIRPKLPGDRVIVNEWTPPQQTMTASTLMEVDQLKGLSTYVKNIEEELQKHNELRGAMLLAFSTRHPNSGKAMANWERKSSYLLREIVKFRTYIDCLQATQAQKEKIYAERAPASIEEQTGEIAVTEIAASLVSD